MRRSSPWIPLTLGLLLALAAPAGAQDGIDKYTLEAFGGTYSLDCAKPTAPRLTVLADALVLVEGDRRLSAGKTMAAASWFGNDSPPEYRTALVGELPRGSQLVFVVSADDQGPYIRIDGEERDLAGFSKATRTATFRRCVAPATSATSAAPKAAAPATPVPAPAASPSTATVTPPATPAAPDPRTDRKFRAAYAKALGPRMRDRWLAVLDGPAPEPRTVRVAGADYVLLASCKAHECDEHSVVLLWSAARKTVYGRIVDAGTASNFGAPPPAVATELARLWTAEWGAKP